jgi:hypothetical protein
VRRNSWDVLVHPNRLADDVVNRFYIHSNPEMFRFLLTFFCFSILSYTTLHALAHLHREPGESQEPRAKSQVDRS